MKTCKSCGKTKEENLFHPRRTSKGTPYQYSECRECVSLKLHHQRNTPEFKAKKRVWDLKQYGLTVHQYEELLKSQNHKCAICGSSDPKRSRTTNFAIDHCHTTGKVRGLLCNPCNLLIGQCKDNTEVLAETIKYLKSSV